MKKPLLTVAIQYEQDVVVARQRARQIAALLGFDKQDQTRIATAVSEVARNAFRYASRGRVEFTVEGDSPPQLLLIRVTDDGPGISDLEQVLNGLYRSTTGMGIGLRSVRRLMDQVQIRTSPERGTDVLLKKMLPARAPVVTAAGVSALARELASKPATNPVEELQQQNQELLRALSELRERQEELEHLNHELEDTNRGVVALYAELDEKADHLRRADEMKSRFLSNMSHEFRTPLNSVRALSGLLLARSDGELTSEQEKQVRFIAKAADDLTALVDDLLDLAKIEAGKIEVRPVEFTVANLFSALRGMLRPLLVSDRVRLVFDEPDPALTTYSDEGKVSQILRNFISNAIKFTESGEVRVSATCADDGELIRFTVADTGIGISAPDQERIFDEFIQVPGPHQANVKGTGLGLPLCRKLSRLLGGDVTLQSEPGVGSTFTAELPLRYVQAGVGATTAAAAPVPEVGRVPVLIVEDHAETRLLYESYLRTSRYQPVGVASLREAREALQRTQPTAIVLDILLRGEDAWRWLSELKANPHTANIPIVVATTVNDERKGLALGADAYFLKPIDATTLLEKLDALTGRHILVIDDDPASRYLFHKLLAGERACIIEAADGREGLLAARRAKPALIFLDLQLPDLSGEEVLRALKEDAELEDIPVVIVTSGVLTGEERERFSGRAQGLLPKSELNVESARRILATSGFPG